MQKLVEDLKAFMLKAGVRVPGTPEIPDDVTILRCAKIVREEAIELVEALGYDDKLQRHHSQPSVRAVAKEAIDTIYVSLYTLVAFGLGNYVQDCWDAVANNNLQKFGEGSTRREGDGKVIPPPGFVKETLENIIR